MGSEHKIDALYVSKHVDLAALLDEFAAEYGVPVVLGGHATGTGQLGSVHCSLTRTRRCRWAASSSLRVSECGSLRRAGAQAGEGG